MDFISNGLGQNKVIIPIISNEYEEMVLMTQKQQHDPFDQIEDIIGKYKSMNAATSELARTKGKRLTCLQEPSEDEKLNVDLMSKLTGGNKNMVHSVFKEPIEFKSQKQTTLVGTDSLFLCILESLDPTMSLLSSDTKASKVTMFKHQIEMDLKDGRMGKKAIVSAENMLNCLNQGDIDICKYLTTLLQKHIAICNSDNTYTFFEIDLPKSVKMDINTCNVYKQTPNNTFEFVREDSLDSIQKTVLESKIQKYIIDGIIQKLDDMLVKDLKELAENIDVPTYHRTDDNKKKPYLKNELKDEIRKKFESYKQ